MYYCVGPVLHRPVDIVEVLVGVITSFLLSFLLFSWQGQVRHYYSTSFLLGCISYFIPFTSFSAFLGGEVVLFVVLSPHDVCILGRCLFFSSSADIVG